MKELLGRFRFGDFSAYFLPGMALFAGVVALLSLGGFVQIASFRGVGFGETVAIACAAYVCGAIISGSSYRLIAPVYALTRLRRYTDPRQEVRPSALRQAVEAALADVVGTTVGEKWSEDHFYLARTAVHERLPQTSAEAMRQNDLMRLRENMIIPTFVWGCVGGWAAVQEFEAGRSNSGLLLIIAAVVLTYTIAGRVACRSVDNREREVREICVGFLIAYRMGLFQPSQALPRQPAVADSILQADSATAKIPVSRTVSAAP